MFFNAMTAVRLVVHRDDFTLLEKIKEKMRGWYDVKKRETMGSEKDEIREVTILERTV